MAWTKVKLADCSELLAGFAFKSRQFTDNSDDSPLVKGENVGQGEVLWEKSKRWPREEWEKYKKFHLKPGDVVVAMDRPWVPAGLKWAVIREGDPQALLVQRVARLRTGDEGKLNQDFLRYLIGSPMFEQYVRPITTGVNVPHISGRQILDFEFVLPPLETQREITSILSPYDDLIENNTRRIKILEEMAQSLYREWFINFRFPGHEKTKFIDSPLGKIPKEWKRTPFSELLETFSGGTWGSDEPNEKENNAVNVIRGTDFKDVREGSALRTPLRFISDKEFERRRLRVGDIIVENSVNAKSRCVGSALLITRGILKRLGENTVCASFCKNFRLKNLALAPLIYLHLRHIYDEGRLQFYQHVATNGIGNFQAKRFVSSEAMAIPSDDLQLERFLSAFGDLTASIYAERINNLRRTRDLLLPRLITGEVIH